GYSCVILQRAEQPLPGIPSSVPWSHSSPGWTMPSSQTAGGTQVKVSSSWSSRGASPASTVSTAIVCVVPGGTGRSTGTQRWAVKGGEKVKVEPPSEPPSAACTVSSTVSSSLLTRAMPAGDGAQVLGPPWILLKQA